MAGDGPGVAKRQLGMALARLRSHAGTSRALAAEAVGCTETSIGRYERGEVAPRPGDLRSLLEHFQVTGELRTELTRLGVESRRRRPKTSYGTVIPDWFRKYVHLEEGASEIRDYNGELIPGLLQTPDYAHAIIAANPLHRPEDVARLVAAREARQQRITSENPPVVWAVLNEAALRRTVGGTEVMRDQLRHLLAVAKLPHITVQVIPFSAGAHASTGFNFILLRFPAGSGGDIAYLEDITNAAQRNDPDEVARYETVFRQLVDTALDSATSAKLITRLGTEL